MSLDWDATACDEAWKELPDAVQHSLIFGCMFTGMGEIKNEKDAQEFYGRYHLLEKTGGPFMNEGPNPRYLKPSEVKAAIGLRTNAFPRLTETKFLTTKVRYDLQNYRRKYQKEIT